MANVQQLSELCWIRLSSGPSSYLAVIFRITRRISVDYLFLELLPALVFMSVKCLVIDDDQFIWQNFKDLFEDHVTGAEILGFAATGSEGIKRITQLKPELVFLDVQLVDMTGFEMLELMGAIDFQVIFVTAHSDYAIKAIRFNALDYLVKPILPEELLDALGRFKMNSGKETNQEHVAQALINLKADKVEDQALILPTQAGEVHLVLKDITKIVGERNYSYIHLANKTKKLASKTLAYFEEILSDKGFFRCHRSYLVNGLFIRKIDHDMFVLKDASRVPISRRKKTAAKTWFGKNGGT